MDIDIPEDLGFTRNINYLKEIDFVREASYNTPFRNSPWFVPLILSLATQQHTPFTEKTFRGEYDYIIVGAGSAGAVLAARISKACSNRSVLLLEAGDSPPLLTELPSAQPYLVGSDIFWNFQTEPQKHAAKRQVGRKVPTACGKVVGGSSTDNNMFYMRGNHKDYDDWARQGAYGWNWNNVFPYFVKAENNTDPDIANNGYHGVNGPLTVERYRYYPDFTQPLCETAQKIGFKCHDINGARQTGFTDLQMTMRNGQRCSTGKAYLVPAQWNPNLDIITKAFVTQIVLKQRTAKGVRFDYKGASFEVRARREVIISAGALGTPKLLMLSGIGPRKTLKKFQIPVISDLPVGLNYHDPAGSIVNFVSIKKRPTFEDTLKDDRSYIEYIKYRTGPLAGMIGLFGLGFLSDNRKAVRADRPDYQVFFLEGSYGDSPAFNLHPKVYKKVYGPYLNKSVIQCIAQDPHPRSRGYVTIQSIDPYADVKINPNFYEDKRDLPRIVQGMKACYRIMRHPLMKKLGYRPFKTRMPGCKGSMTSKKYLACYARSLVTSSYHQVGTAKMGDISDPTTVVDQHMRVKGVINLRVVDSSAIPLLPSGATNNPVIMMAEKISDEITSDC